MRAKVWRRDGQQPTVAQQRSSLPTLPHGKRKLTWTRGQETRGEEAKRPKGNEAGSSNQANGIHPDSAGPAACDRMRHEPSQPMEQRDRDGCATTANGGSGRDAEVRKSFAGMHV